MGLLDDCPRCGRRPEASTAEAADTHLAGCADAAAIAKHSQSKAAAGAKRSKNEEAKLRQEDAMAVAQWEFAGRQVRSVSSSYSLTHPHAVLCAMAARAKHPVLVRRCRLGSCGCYRRHRSRSSVRSMACWWTRRWTSQS